jgi:Holliday junction resolvase-like predicted endonuclease
MNASERIVNTWLQSKGYFTMANILLFQRQEIDILAVKPEGNKLKRLHVEVHVSIKPAGAIRAKRSITTSKEPFEQRIKEVYEKSFIGINGTKRQRVIELFGSDEYEMIHVRSKKLKKVDISPERVSQEFRKHKVEVKWFEDILRDLILHISKGGRTCSEETLSFVQLCNEFRDTDPSKDSNAK